MSQKYFDKLVDKTESRYLLSLVIGKRASQLKRGVPSSLTHKTILATDNAVSVAMAEVAEDSGIVWGAQLPSEQVIAQAVEQDRLGAQREAERFSVTRETED